MDWSQVVDIALLGSTFTTLFVVMDPPGTIPVFLALTRNRSRRTQRKMAVQATLTAFGVIVAFAVLGKYILGFLHISMEALQLSGGFLLFLVAMELLMGKDVGGNNADDENVNVALVPLGTPLLAGPGAIVTVMVSVNQGGNTLPGWVAVIIAVILMHLVIWATMRFSVELQRFLGEGGVMLLTRISGLLLAAIATQLMVEAIFDFIATQG